METEISNLPDKEVKETVIRILTNRESGIVALRENFNKEKEPSRPEEHSNSENTLEGISIRLANTEKQTSDQEDRLVENSRMSILRNDSLRDLWDNIKHSNICIIGSQKKKERNRNFKEIKAKNFPNLGNTSRSRKQRFPNKMNPETHTKTYCS